MLDKYISTTYIYYDLLSVIESYSFMLYNGIVLKWNTLINICILYFIIYIYAYDIW